MRKLGFVISVLLISVFGLQQVFADNLPKIPAVTQCSISPKELPVSGGQVRVQVHIVSLNGVYSGVTAVTDNINKTGEHLFTGSLSRVNGSPQDGDWIGNFVVGGSNTPGNYRLSLFPVTDAQGFNDGYIHCDSEIVNLGVPKIGATTSTSTSALSKNQLTYEQLNILDQQRCQDFVMKMNTKLYKLRDFENLFPNSPRIATFKMKYAIHSNIYTVDDCVIEKLDDVIKLERGITAALLDDFESLLESLLLEQVDIADKAAADKAAADKAAADKIIQDAKNEAASILAEAKAAATKKITITCVKAKLTKKVTAANPKCPSGYKKKA